MNVATEMTRLYYCHPGPDACPVQVAAWYVLKGRLHEQLAAEGGPDAATELGHAAASYKHACRLLLESRGPARRQPEAAQPGYPIGVGPEAAELRPVLGPPRCGRADGGFPYLETRARRISAAAVQDSRNRTPRRRRCSAATTTASPPTPAVRRPTPEARGLRLAFALRTKPPQR